MSINNIYKFFYMLFYKWIKILHTYFFYHKYITYDIMTTIKCYIVHVSRALRYNLDTK